MFNENSIKFKISIIYQLPIYHWETTLHSSHEPILPAFKMEGARKVETKDKVWKTRIKNLRNWKDYLSEFNEPLITNKKKYQA